MSRVISPQKSAKNFRKIYNLGDRPIRQLKNTLDNEGVRIFELPVPNDEFSGISFWHSDYGPCILLNYNELQGRRNFTLAHEFAHLLYGHGASVCHIPIKIGRISAEESKANRFAVEVLLPGVGIIEDFRKGRLSKRPSWDELRNIANKWGVSIQAFGYRLEDLNVIERGHTDTLVETRRPFFRRSKTPQWEKQLGKRFVETSIEAYQKGLISIGKLAHALRIPIEKAMETVERLS